ncbi:unnamed protein product [Merluccius merluccius]
MSCAVLCLVLLIPTCSYCYELQDTIHTLKEENLHLQRRLENITRALRDLKHLLLDHSKVSGGDHDSDSQHSWNDWAQHGLSPDTHHMLEQAFCSSDPHGNAEAICTHPLLLFLVLFSLSLVWLSPMLL